MRWDEIFGETFGEKAKFSDNFLKKGKIFKVIISDNIGIIKTFSMRVRILKLNSGNAYFNNDNNDSNNNNSKKCVSEVYGFCAVCMWNLIIANTRWLW